MVSVSSSAVFLKSASFVSFTDKNFKCLTEIKILSVRMSDTKIQDILHRTRTCLPENYSVWHDVSFCQTECLTSFKSFQEVCVRVTLEIHVNVFFFVRTAVISVMFHIWSFPSLSNFMYPDLYVQFWFCLFMKKRISYVEKQEYLLDPSTNISAISSFISVV